MNTRTGARAWPYAAIVAVCAAIYFLYPDQLPLAARIAAMAIFVMSLDLVVGYGGLATLGHSALFGVGAYAAGIFATHASGNPIVGLAVGAAAGAGLSLISGLFLLRYEGLTFLMLTIAVGQIIHNLASKLRRWTGGEDGLSGFNIDKILGVASFDLQGRVAFLYCAAVMLVCLVLMRHLMGSPFGLACLGIHQNRIRMVAIGSSIRSNLLRLYVWAGVFAGISGALMAQITQIVGLDSLGFELAADGLVMLVLGGAGSLYGAIAGTAVFMTVHHVAAAIDPYHWLFIIGGMLVVLVLFPREQLLHLARKLARGKHTSTVALAGSKVS